MGQSSNIIYSGVINPIKIKPNLNLLDLKEDNLQEHLSKISQDPLFNNFVKIEKNELKNIILSDKEYQNIIKSWNFEFDLKEIGIIDNDNNRNRFNLIENIIKNEDTLRVFENKIIDEINNIKNNKEKFPIKYLTILLVGRKGIGKTTLVDYIFGFNEENKQDKIVIKDENFTTYSKKNFPLKIIEFKGFGYDINNSVDYIAEEALKCIQELRKKNKGTNFNEFVHCIWFLINGTRFVDIEENFYKKLSKAYNNSNIPIILVYNQASEESAKQMENYISNYYVDVNFVKVLPVNNKRLKTNIFQSSFGDEELINKTLLKCSYALESDLIELMTEVISNSIKNQMLSANKKLESDININLEYEFKKFNVVLNDEELKNFIVNLFEKSIYYFYKGYIGEISKQSLFLLNESDIIKKTNEFIAYYKPKFLNIINSKLNYISKTLINEQANLEKNNNKNESMRVDSKRNLKKFKETTTTYFKRNYYYIAQKYVIDIIIQNVLKKFIITYRKGLDTIIIKLLNDKKNENIINNLQNCFLAKLKMFAINNGINIKIEFKQINPRNDLNNASINEFPAAKIRSNSIDLINNFDIDEINEKEIFIPKKERNWYIYKEKKWVYLKENTAISLKNFLEENIVYQEEYFKQKNKDNDKALELLKNYEKNELIRFFHENYTDFVKHKICQVYNLKYALVNRNTINDITSNKIFEEVYIKKLNNIIDSINSNLNTFQINYLTIVLIGRSGVGKSTLINSLLKEKVAKTGFGNIVTQKNTLYNSANIPFLKLYDTRGIELTNQYGPENILKNAINIIDESEKKNDYIDYVNCIWYCVSDNNIDDKEIEIIKVLREKKKSIPLIIVYSHAIFEQGFNTIRLRIKEEFPNAIFIPVLAKKSDKYDSFGLDELLEKTIEMCNEGLINGKFYKTMRANISKYIIKSFKEEYESIKINVSNNITNNFINNFKTVLNEEQLYNYIYNLFEKLFLEFLKINNIFEHGELNQGIKNSLKNVIKMKEFIGNFINHYKRKTKELVDSIKDEKALEFIDKQIYYEKYKQKSINVKDKCNLDDFTKIIENYLNDNFYYASQKYIIYRIITDASEEILMNIEKNVSKFVDNLINRNSQDLLKKIYMKKFEDYENFVNSFRMNNKIYRDLSTSEIYTPPLNMISYLRDLSSAPSVIPNF